MGDFVGDLVGGVGDLVGRGWAKAGEILGDLASGTEVNLSKDGARVKTPELVVRDSGSTTSWSTIAGGSSFAEFKPYIVLGGALLALKLILGK